VRARRAVASTTLYVTSSIPKSIKQTQKKMTVLFLVDHACIQCINTERVFIQQRLWTADVDEERTRGTTPAPPTSVWKSIDKLKHTFDTGLEWVNN
jgi:hypothetical protein